MTKIHVCYAAYNEESLIRSSLDLLFDYVDTIHVFCGKFRDNQESNDDTRKILQEYNADVFYTPNLSQMEARNLLYSKVPDDDWIFIVDGDEMIVGDVKKLCEFVRQSNHSMIQMPCFNNGRPWMPYSKFFKQKGLNIKEKHWMYYFKDQLIFDGTHCNIPFEKTELAYLLNCNPLRSEDRNQERETFRNFMAARKFVE